MENDELFPTTAGTPQGGVASPLLANIALHGLEETITQQYPQAKVIRYADDLVILHPDLPVIEQIQQTVANWLAQIGLELKPSKTRITHTFHSHQGAIGFDFLGFHIRQYPVGKTHSAKSTGRHPKLLGFKTIIKPSQTALKRHQQALRAVIKRHRSISQARLIGQLNPIIKGWTAYYSTVCSKATFSKMAHLTFLKLKRWAYRRHSGKSRTWVIHKYWRLDQNCWDFAPPEGKRLYYHNKTPIQRYVKVKGNKSPYDGDWLYWSNRNRQQPGTPKRITTLLHRQKGRCTQCGLYFRAENKLQLDHIIPTAQGGRNGYINWQLLHAHCHHHKTAQENKRPYSGSTCDKSQTTEERSDAKVSRSVLKPSGGGDSAT